MHSIGAIILHMAEAEVFWFENFALGQPADREEMDQDARRRPVPPSKPLAWSFDLHESLPSSSSRYTTAPSRTHG